MVWISQDSLIWQFLEKYRTADHLVFVTPWPVTGHIATANVLISECDLNRFLTFIFGWRELKFTETFIFT